MMRICLLLVVTTLAIAAAEPADIPRVAEHTPYSTTVYVRNPFDRAVAIKRVDASCTCMELKMQKQFLLPFETVAVDFTVDNKLQSGKHTHRIWMEPSNPSMTTLEVAAHWYIIPNIAVDLLGGADEATKRPDDKTRRDVYAYTTWVRPDEISERLGLRGPGKKLIRLFSPEEVRPKDGLKIEDIVYTGKIWTFTQRNMPDGAILLVAHASKDAPNVAEGKYTEKVTLKTNHPDKPTIELTFNCAIDKNAHAKGAIDPWGHLR